jgi:hypothetical protein
VTDPNTSIVEDDEGSALQILFNGRKVGQDQHELLAWASAAPPTVENHRREDRTLNGEQPAKIGVRRDQYSSLCCCPGEDLLVG